MKQSTRYMCDVVTQEIMQLILTDKLHQGEVLPSASTMAKKLSLSRRSVREVYLHLSYVGMLDHSRGNNFYLVGDVADGFRGYLRVLLVMRQISPYHVCDVRCMMDLSALKLAFERWEQLDIEQLGEYIEQMQYGNLLESIDADEKTHLWLIYASGNQLMSCMIESIWDICGTQVNLILTGGEEELCSVLKKIHERLYKGFLHRNYEQAFSAIQEHYAVIKKALQELEQHSPQLFHNSVQNPYKNMI